jgi:hypothetical protein
MKLKLPSEIVPFNKWIAFIGKLPLNQPIEHRIIIVHKTETEINYFYVTSKIENSIRIYKCDKLALVKVSPSEWSALTCDSCIQCGRKHMYRINVDDIKNMYERNELEFLGEIPDKLKKQIIDAILNSKTYTEMEKNKFTQH